jgi:glycosyltransferase involved in cell wall biosynthesis
LAGEGELEVVVPGPGAVAELFGAFAGVTTLEYEALTRPASGVGGAVAALRTLARDVRRFRALIREHRAELVVVVTAMLPAALIAAHREGATVVVYCGEIFEQRGMRGAQLAARRGLLRLTGRLADGIAAGSGTVARQFDGMRCPVVEIVYPPVPPEFAAGDGPGFRARHGIATGAPLVAAAGSLTEGRGQDVLVRAVALARESRPDLACVIAGAPFERAQDRAFAARLEALRDELGLGDAVQFAGQLDDVPGLLAAADAVVNPARFDEPFGRVPFEAALAGTPAVVTRVGAVPELFRDRDSALVVAPDDPGELAAAITRLLEDAELASRLAAAAADFARERLSPQASADGFRRVVEAALRAG